MKFSLTIAFLISFSVAFGQVPPKHISLSDKHIAKVNKIKDPEKKLKKYRKFYSRDSARHVRAVKRYWKREIASSYKQQATSASKTRLGEEIEGQLNEELTLGEQLSVDSVLLEKAKEKGKEEWEALEKPEELEGLEVYKDVKLDSTLKQRVVSELKSEAKAKFDQLEKPKEVEELLAIKGIQLDSTLTDSATVAKVRKQLISRGEQELRKTSIISELDENKAAATEAQKRLFQTPEEVPLKDGQLDSAALKQQALETAKTQLMRVAQRTGAMNQVNRLKNKYGKVLNSNDLSTAVKRNSLKGEPFGQRLVLGGNFNLLDTDPFSVDLSGSLGYKFTKRLLLGVQGSHRVGQADSASVSGGRTFVNYDLAKNFYVAGEFELMRQTLSTESATREEWHPGFFLGVGRKFSLLPKVNAQVALMYNFLHENRGGIYNRPLVVRFGLSFEGVFKK